MASESVKRVRGAVGVAAIIALSPLMRAQGSAPIAAFTWSMQKHVASPNGWNEATQTYAPGYVNPANWPVDFNACASSAGIAPIASFAWTIKDESATTLATLSSASCLLTFLFPTQGRHFTVILRVTNGAGQQGTTTQDVFIRDFLIVALGDSIASGEGNPDVPQQYDPFFGPPIVVAGPKWESKRCHRSAQSAPARAARQLEDADPHTSITFISFACSGASIAKGVLEPFAGMEVPAGAPDLAPQIVSTANAVNGRHIDAIFLSGGANDIGFISILKGALLPFPDVSTIPFLSSLLATGLALLPPEFQLLATQLSSSLLDNNRLPPSQVYVMEYPDITHSATGAFCNGSPLLDPLSGVTAADAQFASVEVIGKLNEVVSKAGSQPHWTFVGNTSSAFATHGYCAGTDRFVNTTGDSLFIQGNDKGLIHPNSLGTAIYTDRLFRATSVRLSPALAVSVKLNTGARAGTLVTVTVGAVDQNSGEQPSTALWWIDNGSTRARLVDSITAVLGGGRHTVTVFDPNHATSITSFDLPLQDMTVTLDHPVALNVLTSVTVFAKDSLGRPIPGTVTITNTTRSTDPLFKSACNPPTTLLANCAITGIFRVQFGHFIDPTTGEITFIVNNPTATVSFPNFKTTTIDLVTP